MRMVCNVDKYLNAQVYVGRKPKVFICDPDMAKQVFIKESDKFPNRGFTDEFQLGDFGSEMMDFCVGNCICVLNIMNAEYKR